MHVLNAAESSQYFDAEKDAREDGAVRLIHWAWLEHSSTLARREYLEPAAPLDMLVLYQAAAAAFREWDRRTPHQEQLAHGGRIINWEQAERRLNCIPDATTAALATRFANQVIALSNKAAGEQDLNYFVELFLSCIKDKRVIEGIVSGSISKDSRELTNLDLW